VILRSLIAFSLLALSAAATPQTRAQVFIPATAVPLVDCAETAGSAFRVSEHLLLSVNHVVSGADCKISGQPIHIEYKSRKSDFAAMSDDRSGQWLKVDCRGFIEGHEYLALGHARAMQELTAVPLTATGFYDDGMARLTGVFTAQPGQSGGPIIDAETGEAVGTVNAANWEYGTTFSVELKGTWICKGNVA
jgi:hypothetical protein